MNVVSVSQVSSGSTPSSAREVVAMNVFRHACLRDGRPHPASVSETLLAASVWCGYVATQLREQADAFETERTAFETEHGALVAARHSAIADTERALSDARSRNVRLESTLLLPEHLEVPMTRRSET